MGYDERAVFQGVYLWESLNVLWPAEHGACHNSCAEPDIVRAWLAQHDLPHEWVPNRISIPNPHGVGWIDVDYEPVREVSS